MLSLLIYLLTIIIIPLLVMLCLRWSLELTFSQRPSGGTIGYKLSFSFVALVMSCCITIALISLYSSPHSQGCFTGGLC